MKVDKSKWEVKKLGEVCTIISGSTPRTNVQENWIDGKYYWITPAELSGEKYVSKTERLISDYALKHTNLTLMPIGTVLLSSRAPIGKVAITTSPMYCNQGFKNLFCSNMLYNEFIYFYLKGKTEQLNYLGKGVTFKEISRNIVSDIKVLVPPLPEQQAIASELDAIQSLITKYKEQLNDYDNLAKSIFNEMFGDVVSNDKGWERKKLGEITKVKIGPFGSLLHKNDYLSNGIPIVNPIHMINGAIVVNQNFTINENKYKELSSYVMKTGDIVMGRRGDIGRCALVDEKCNGYICGTGSLFIKSCSKLIPIFLLKSLMTNQIIEYLNNKAKGATMLNINCDIVNKLPIPLPPLPLQQKFAARITAIESQKDKVKQQIADLQTLFDSRMQYYFD
jgi:type I restriction enzyme S subunit